MASTACPHQATQEAPEGASCKDDGGTSSSHPSLGVEAAVDDLKQSLHSIVEESALPVDDESGTPYCPECYLPLHPDPKPEKLFIFLHALRYTTGLGAFETEMPFWAAEDYRWDRS